MISEKDIADFKAIDCTRARQAVKKVIYFNPNEHQYGEGLQVLTDLLDKIELLQQHVVKQVPALFKEKS